MDTATAACLQCATLQIEFLGELQKGHRPTVEAFTSRHVEHAEQLREMLASASTVHTEFTPHQLQPPGALEATLTLRGDRFRLGRGGQAEVHSFVESELNHEVAVKFPRGDTYVNCTSEERDAINRRFWREAQIVSRLNHPGVAPIFAHGICDHPVLAPLPPANGSPPGTVDGSGSPTTIQPFQPETADKRPATGATRSNEPWPFLVMRRILGKTLSESENEFRLAGRRLVREDDRWRFHLDNFRKVCQTIAHAHRHGVVHLDLKPENIVVDENGVTTVLDWGVSDFISTTVTSKETSSDSITGATGQNSPIGTLYYMAPEQAAGRHDLLGPRTDVYGLGGILFYMLTGQAPHAGRTFEQIAKGVTPGATCGPSTVPPELASICARAMSLKSDDRYASAEELEREIDLWLANQKVTAHVYSLREKLLRWTRIHLAATAASVTVLVTLVLSATIAFSVIKVAQGRARAADDQRRNKTLTLETVLTVRDLDDAVHNLITGENRIRFRPDDDSPEILATSATGSWDTRYLDHALAKRPAAHTTITTGRWGVVAAAFDENSRRFAVAHADGDLSVWDIDRREMVRQLARSAWDNENRITIHYAERTRLENEGNGQVEWFTSLAWLGNGDSLVAATMSGRGLMFDVTSGEVRELLAGDKPLLAIAASTDGKVVLFGDSTGRVFRRSLAEEPPMERLVTTAETTAITCLDWHEPLSAWIVGDAAGRAQILDGATLETIASAELPGPIWSMDAAEYKEETRIAVGSGEGRVSVFRFERDTNSLLPGPWLPLPQAAASGQAAHVLRFGPSGDRLWAIDADGILVEWVVSEQQLLWSNKAVRLDQRLSDVRNRGSREPPVKMPLPFRRTASAILITGPGSLLTAGDDGLALLWQVPPRSGGVLSGTTVHERLVGPGARMAFSRTLDEHLWAIDIDGQLIVSDANSGAVLARRLKAHSGSVPDITAPLDRGVADIAALPDGGVVTAGGDRELRFWRLSDGTLEAARKRITHEHPLISVTVSADGKWLAAVDEHSGFGVWKISSGERQFFEQMPAISGRPFTGRTAFNADGTWLAAFGAGQCGCIFTCREVDDRLIVRQLSDKLNVAGTNGGSALAWNPAFPDRLAFADDYPRLVIRSFGETAALEKAKATGLIDHLIVDIVPTPDGRRLILIGQNGRLVSYDVRHDLRMVELNSSLNNVVGMAIDRQGQRLAIVNGEGTVEVWHTSTPVASSLPEPKNSSVEWTATDWLHQDSALTAAEPRTLRFDAQGQAHFLMSESQPGDFPGDCALYYVSEARSKITRERITAGNPEFDRRMNGAACGLELHGNQPLVVFRCHMADNGPYDGKLFVARRTAPGVWERELIHEQGNQGFYPVMLVNDAGQLTDVFHYSFAGFYLLHSFRHADKWDVEILGEQGDGYQIKGCKHGNVMHLITDTNRFNGDNGNKVYLQWKPGGGEPLREPLPAAFGYPEAIRVLPDGRPIVAQLRHDSGSFTRLLTRTENGWQEYQRLPEGLELFADDWVIGPDGATYVAAWQVEEERVVLWRGLGDAWSGQIIATGENLPEAPNARWVRFDPQGHPVVVVGKLYEPFSWLKAYRSSTTAK